MSKLRIARVEAFAFRYPNTRIVETSFGRMLDRPAVFVRVEDDEGAFGWGEVFANWPAAGAEHRVRLLELDIAPLVLGRQVESPVELFEQLTRVTRIRALQCGEEGPFRQVIAGLDTAVWDLFARRAGLPLRRFLRADAPDSVSAYASGIDFRVAEDVIADQRAAGFTTFKVKVGFGRQPPSEAEEVVRLANGLGIDEHLCADANQAWDRDSSMAFLERVESAGLLWLEEPIAADASDQDWAVLAQFQTPLAGGENISGLSAFDHTIAAGSLAVIQPDVAKWGGLSGCFEVARRAMNAGLRYCPHFLGGGIGLLASAELLAAAGGDGLLEVDSNQNPLRDAFLPEAPIEDGKWRCSSEPGLGITDLPVQISHYETARVDLNLA